jgi:DNA-directed RNA polymerase subunit E'/Rpb7
MWVEKQVYLEPSFLDKNIKKHIQNQIEKDMIGNCSQEYGYVMNIGEGIEILSNSVSNTEVGVYFLVKFRVETLKPESGKKYTGKIFMLFQEGIFIEVIQKLKVLVPFDKLAQIGYKYDKDNNTFVKGKNVLKKDTEVQFQIDLIRYEKQNFNCIGSL